MKRCRATAALLACLLVASCAPSHKPIVNARLRHALYSTRDFGRTWIPADSGLAESLQVNVLVPWGERLVVATENRGLFIGTPGRGDWAQAGTGLPGAKITAVHVAAPRLYVGVYGHGLFVSENGGGSWRPLNGSLPDPRVRAIVSVKAGLLVGTDAGVFLVGTGDSTWTHMFTDGQIISFNKSGSRIVGGGARGTVLSEDDGLTWHWIHKEGAAHNTAILDDRIVLMQISGDLLISRDWGATWAAQKYGPRENSYVYDVVGSGPQLVASNNYGIHVSTDGGLHWEHVYKTEDLVFMDLVVMNGFIYGGTRDWRERRSRVY